MEEKIICPQCGSNKITIQAVNEVEFKNAHHSIWWWLFVGWWWMIIKWLIFTLPALIIKLIKGKKKKVINKIVKKGVCQQCGHIFDIK